MPITACDRLYQRVLPFYDRLGITVCAVLADNGRGPPKQRRARRIHIILDNYIIHSSRPMQTNLAQFGNRVVLHFLLPYCPDHKKVERVWQDLHANVTRNHCCRRMVDLMANVHTFLTIRNRGLASNRRPIKAYRESGSAI